jgi:carbon-monoxide dehydrogenase medium subunit
MVMEIVVPEPAVNMRGVYLKLPSKTAIGIAVVGVGAVLTFDKKSDVVADAKIVLGAVAPTPMRARKAETLINGSRLNDELIEKAAQIASEESKPITDIRGSELYRRHMVRVMTRQALRELACAV